MDGVMICCVIGDWSTPTAFLNIIVNYFESTPVGHGGPTGSGTVFRSWSPCFFLSNDSEPPSSDT